LIIALRVISIIFTLNFAKDDCTCSRLTLAPKLPVADNELSESGTVRQ
jgi:hypothetical protein